MKAMKNFKFFDVTDWTTNNYNAHIAIISRSKGNQTITFGQLIEYNMRNFFLEKAYTKCGGESILGFMDNCKLLGISLSQHCVKIVQIRSFFWCVFSCIRNEYGYLQGKSLYLFRIQENTDQKKLRIWTLFTQCSNNCQEFSEKIGTTKFQKALYSRAPFVQLEVLI